MEDSSCLEECTPLSHFTKARWIVVFLLVFGLFILESGNVFAQTNSASCSTISASASCSSYNVEFDGADRTAGVWGADSTIGDYQVSSVCQASAAWVMIDDANYNGGYALWQVGYVRLASWSTKVTYIFVEYGSTSSTYSPTMLTAFTSGWGSSTYFSVWYDTTDNWLDALYGNQEVDHFNPGWSANDQEWVAETHSDSDYVVGGYNHHSIFANDRYLYNGKKESFENDIVPFVVSAARLSAVCFLWRYPICAGAFLWNSG